MQKPVPWVRELVLSRRIEFRHINYETPMSKSRTFLDFQEFSTWVLGRKDKIYGYISLGGGGRLVVDLPYRKQNRVQDLYELRSHLASYLDVGDLNSRIERKID